jgi:hypothetical protein
MVINRRTRHTLIMVGLSVVLTAAAAMAQPPPKARPTQFNGRVVGEFGRPIEAASVYITGVQISVFTNADGIYTMNIPAARATGQQLNLQVRAIGYQAGTRPIRLTPGIQTIDFQLKQDVNRLQKKKKTVEAH